MMQSCNMFTLNNRPSKSELMEKPYQPIKNIDFEPTIHAGRRQSSIVVHVQDQTLIFDTILRKYLAISNVLAFLQFQCLRCYACTL